MSDEEIDFTDAKMLRELAEQKLKEVQKHDSGSKTDIDEAKLLHELQVHQIELEMQNEELQQAYEISELALKKYTMLYDFAPLGYFTIDPEGNIIDLNFTGAEMLSDKRISLIGRNFKLFISDESKKRFGDFFRKVFMSNAKEWCQVMLAYNNEPLCLVYMEGIVLENEHQCLLSVINVSALKK
jgi:PAS domain-containing protein